MKNIAATLRAAVSLAAAGGMLTGHAVAADTSLRETTEVISVLKSNYVDRDKLNDKLLNEATVDGLVNALGHGVLIMTPPAPSTNEVKTVVAKPLPSPALARAEVIDPNIGYIRLSDVTDGTPAALDAELKQFADANVTGYVLDLRFADGTNFTAAAEVASRFLTEEQELFTLKSSEAGTRVFRTTSEAKAGAAGNADLTSAPMMLLVNAQTRGSAEALAGALRARDRGILIGSVTAGSAVAWQDVKLPDGRTLRVATAKIVLPPFTDGGKPIDLFPNGIAPDVAVKIDTQVEYDVVFAPPTNETLTVSLQPRANKKEPTEAQLVKAFHGLSVDTDETSSEGGHEEEGEIQNVRDVVLQRAVDILKGIRVLLSWQ
jgi:hypothetical protein